MWLLITVAMAGEPTRCVATWTGPVAGCGLSGTYTVEETASTAKGAERGAHAELLHLLDLQIAARRIAVSALTESNFAMCKQEAATAFVSCFAEPALGRADAFCFAVFDAPDCWPGEVLSYQDDAWRVLDEARSDMCARSDAWLVAQNYSNLEIRRADCAARGEAKRTVPCP